jgi:hypothetical protein
MSQERIETERLIAAPADQIFALLCDPQGHVAIDSSGMLQDATGTIKPPIGHVYGYRLDPLAEGGTRVTTYYDLADARHEWKPIFPVISENALRGTLGILDRTVRRGYVRP